MNRFALLSLIPLTLLLLGFAALAVPEPALAAWPGGDAPLGATLAAAGVLQRGDLPVAVTDLAGLALLGAATLGTLAIALAWESRRRNV